MPSKLILCLAIVAAVMQSFAVGIWDYARPDSDALIYLDVGRAEKAMDKELWEKIESDKKAAQKKDAESRKDEGADSDDGFDFMRGFADLNPELVANVTLVSRDPLRLMIEGAVRFQSGGAADAKKAMDGFSELFKGDDASEPMSLTIKEKGAGVHEFLMLFNLKGKVSLPPPPPSATRQHMSNSFLASKPSAFFVMNSIRWAPLLANSRESRSLRRLMVLADSVGVSAVVGGKEISLSAEATFRREQDALAYSKDASSMVGDVEKVVSGPILRGIVAVPRGKSVTLSAKISIGDAWMSLGSVSAFQNGAVNNEERALPSAKK